MAEKRSLNALMLGDVCGQPGLRALFVSLGILKRDLKADIVVVNGENAADGFGLSVPQMNQLFTLGADVITSGNHIWQQEDLRPFLDSEKRLLRPANYPDGVAGHGMCVVSTSLCPVAVINLQGRIEMPVTDDPFRVGLKLAELARRQTPVVLVDFHAEATDEKEALGFYLDGKVSAVVGTHTHVGTAYQTDIGFTGPKESVIGSVSEISIQKQLSQMPLRTPIKDGDGEINGVLICVDPASGKAISIKRIHA